MKNFLAGVVITVGAINVALFFLWLSLVKVQAVSDKAPEYVYNTISINFTILQITLGVVAFDTAVAGFFGYQAIKDGAMKKAHDTAATFLREEGKRLIEEEVSKRAIFYNQSARPQHEP